VHCRKETGVLISELLKVSPSVPFAAEWKSSGRREDFSTTYIGAGMICPHIVNVSVLLGGILSWGVLWPLIAQKRGSWFDAELADTSLEGMQGYRVLCHLLSNVS
jgi:uncharacterized oligopeptide transporter (OPT) family protein